jgi:hypothetical protein
MPPQASGTPVMPQGSAPGASLGMAPPLPSQPQGQGQGY